MVADRSNQIDLYKLVDTEHAADFYNVTPRKMEKMRQDGTGPKFVRISRKCVRYRIIDLIEHQEKHLRKNTIYGAA